MFGVKFNVAIIGREVDVVGELHEIAVDFAVVCALMRLISATEAREGSRRSNFWFSKLRL